MNIDQEKISLQIRMALEDRLAHVLHSERASLPMLSIAEIVSLLFGLHGHWNIFGGFAETTSAIRALIGEELFWNRPKVPDTEPDRSTNVH